MNHGSYGPRHEKTYLRGANNTGADHPAHRRSLVSTFVIHSVESIICKLATGEISIFWLVPVAEKTGLKLALSETPKTGFVATRLICNAPLHDLTIYQGSARNEGGVIQRLKVYRRI